MPENRRAVRVGRVTIVAHADRDSLDGLVDRVTERGFGVRQTEHFAVCRKPGLRDAIVMHAFDGASIDEDLSPIIADELGHLGIADSAQEFGDVLFGIVASTCPSSLDCPDCGRLHLDHPAIWRQYCLNTLHRLRLLITGQPSVSDLVDGHVVQFAAIYRRIIRLCTGISLLDVGSSLGFLPILVAEHLDGMTVVGSDMRLSTVAAAADLASAARADRVSFLVKDVLAPDLVEAGRFDTVTAVHLLEHLDERDVPVALTNMLSVAARRLIVAVPYEERVQALYGHEQAFTPGKLHLWGKWCVEMLGAARYRCEEVSGGLLVVDQPPADGDAS